MAAPIRLEAMDTQIDPAVAVRGFPIRINTFNDLKTIADSASFDAFTPADIPERIFTPAPIIGQIDHTHIPNNSTLQLSDGTLITFNEQIGRGVDGSVYKITYNGTSYCIKISNYNNNNRFREILGEFLIQSVIYNASMNDNHYDCPYTTNTYGIIKFKIRDINVLGICQELITNSMTLSTWIQTRQTETVDSIIGQTFNKDIIRITRRLQNLWRLFSFNHADLHTKNILVIHENGDTNKHKSIRLIDFGHSLLSIPTKMFQNYSNITTPKEGRDLTHLSSYLKTTNSSIPYINNNPIVNYVYTDEIKGALEGVVHGQVTSSGTPKPTFFGAYTYFNTNDHIRAHPSNILTQFNIPASGGPIGDVRESCGKAPIVAAVPLAVAARPPLAPTASGAAAARPRNAAPAAPVAFSGFSGTVSLRPVNTSAAAAARAKLDTDLISFKHNIDLLSDLFSKIQAQLTRIDTAKGQIITAICGRGRNCLYGTGEEKTRYFSSLPSEARKSAITESNRYYDTIAAAEDILLGKQTRIGTSSRFQRSGWGLLQQYTDLFTTLESRGQELIDIARSFSDTDAIIADITGLSRNLIRPPLYIEQQVTLRGRELYGKTPLDILISGAEDKDKELDRRLRTAIARVERWWNPRKEKSGQNWDEAVRLAQSTSNNASPGMADLIVELQEEWAQENREAAAEARRQAAAEARRQAEAAAETRRQAEARRRAEEEASNQANIQSKSEQIQRLESEIQRADQALSGIDRQYQAGKQNIQERLGNARYGLKTAMAELDATFKDKLSDAKNKYLSLISKHSKLIAESKLSGEFSVDLPAEINNTTLDKQLKWLIKNIKDYSSRLGASDENISQLPPLTPGNSIEAEKILSFMESFEAVLKSRGQQVSDNFIILKEMLTEYNLRLKNAKTFSDLTTEGAKPTGIFSYLKSFIGGGDKTVNINTNKYTLSITINNTKGLLIAPFLYFGGIKTVSGGRFKKYNKTNKRKLKDRRNVLTAHMPTSNLYTRKNPMNFKSHKKLTRNGLQPSVNYKVINTMMKTQVPMKTMVTTEGIMNTSAEDIIQYIRFITFSNINSDTLTPLVYSLTTIPLREKNIAENLANVINSATLEKLKEFVDKYGVSNIDEKLINKNWPRNIKDMKTTIELYMSEENPETARKLLRFLIYADFNSKENYNAFIEWFKSSPSEIRAELGDYYTNAILI